MFTRFPYKTQLEQVIQIYHRIFFIKEIEESPILQWVFVATLLSYFVTFNSWISRNAVTTEAYLNNDYLCWPYFQDCGSWYFLSALPEGYSQTILYMAFFALIGAIAFCMWRGRWVYAHMGMVVLFTWKILLLFVLSMSFIANYEYYHIIFSFFLLFSAHKIFFLRVVFVILYFLSSTVKFHEGWILGTYFTSLKTGLPLFPELAAPLVTNFVIFMQVIGSWFLLSSKKTLQRAALVYFALFHLYSGILVYYRYPTTVLPMLFILFGPWQKVPIPLDRKAIAGWLVIALLFLGQLAHVMIAGDVKLTLEGNHTGMYMFEANHQCVSKMTVERGTLPLEELTVESPIARNRCDPYAFWFGLKQICKRDGTVTAIRWQFDHSINGGPFYRIVDEKNICDLEYRMWRHNDWIKLPPEAPIIGVPVQNVYY